MDQGYVETCEQVLHRAKANRKEWISKETRKQKRDANKRYPELKREMNKRSRRDGRVYVESEAERAEKAGKRGDTRTL